MVLLVDSGATYGADIEDEEESGHSVDDNDTDDVITAPISK